MKNQANLLIFLLFIAVSGCYKMRNQISMTTRIEKIPIENSIEERIVADKFKIDLNTYFENEFLIVEAIRKETCVDDEIVKYERTDYIRKELPRRYRAYLSSGLALTGAGALFTSLGAVGINRNYPKELGDVQKENKYDTITTSASYGLVLGSAIGSAGIMMLISSIIDAAAAKDEIKKRKPEITRTVLKEKSCNDTPASGITLYINNGLSNEQTSQNLPQYTVNTEHNGSVQIPLLNNDKIKDFRFSKNFFTVSCNHCQPVTVTLPAEISARVVIENNDYDEMKEWLLLYPLHSSGETVRKAYLKLIEEKDAEQKEKQAQLEDECASGQFQACTELGKLREFYSRDCNKNVSSCLTLAEMYRSGKEGPVDLKQAMNLFSKACKGMLGTACTQIGHIWLNDNDEKKNIKTAQNFYKKGCRYGDEDGCIFSNTIDLAQKELAAQAKLNSIKDKLPFTADDFEYEIAWGHLTIKFNLTAKQNISTLWIVSEARCSTGDKIFKANSLPVVVKELNRGDSSIVQTSYYNLPEANTLKDCSLKFGIKRNFIFDTATIFEVLNIKL